MKLQLNQIGRVTRATIAAVALLGAVSSSATPAGAYPNTLVPAVASGYGDYQVTTHRGFRLSGSITENTLESAQYAMSHGATAIELDVMATSDSKLVIMHDSTLGRTTTCTGYVKYRTFDEITNHCFGQKGHERIPSFTTFLNWAHASGANLLVEIKNGGKTWTPALLDQVIAEVDATSMNSRVRFLSYNTSALDYVESVRPEFFTVAVVDHGVSVSAKAAAAPNTNVFSMCAIDMTPATRDYLAGKGIGLGGRLTDNATDWAVFRHLGVRSVTVDNPSSYVGWATGRSSGPSETKPCPQAPAWMLTS